VRLLLDTHALLWSVEAPGRLSNSARRKLEDTANDLFFSAASIWEVSIKISAGKLRLALLPEELVEVLVSRQFTELPIRSLHAGKLALMPLHHRDPFDRLLIAQAQVEDLTLVSKDGALDAYGIQRLW
jgi:PIN domain nuclease of toxin-antitoxin system